MRMPSTLLRRLPLWLMLPCAAIAQPVPDYVTNALTWAERPALEKALDGLLKPAEVMIMAEVEPGMKVVDLMPGSGYYTRILSGIVGDEGKVYSFIPQSNGIGETGPVPSPRVRQFGAGPELSRLERVTNRFYQVNIARNTDIYLEWVNGDQYPSDLRYGNFALPEQVDVVITQFAYHIFKSPEFSNTDMERFLGAVYRGMNNGGVMLVIDNRAAEGMSPEEAAALNRVSPAAVIEEMTNAGFALEEESDLIALADDDHSRMAEDLFLARNPTPADVFVLKFRKPADAPVTNRRPEDPLEMMRDFFGNSIVIGNGVDYGDNSVHLFHADGTYQEMRGTSFDSGQWFFNADGWNCRYRPGRSFADCATAPGEYAGRRLGDEWEAPHGHYELHEGYDYSILFEELNAAP